MIPASSSWTNIRIENQIGSSPSASTSGMKTGIETIMMEIVSIKQPSTSTMSCMMITIARGDRSSAATASTSEDVDPVAARICENPADPTITSSIIDVVVVVDIRAVFTASQVSRR